MKHMFKAYAEIIKYSFGLFVNYIFDMNVKYLY